MLRILLAGMMVLGFGVACGEAASTVPVAPTAAPTTVAVPLTEDTAEQQPASAGDETPTTETQQTPEPADAVSEQQSTPTLEATPIPATATPTQQPTPTPEPTPTPTATVPAQQPTPTPETTPTPTATVPVQQPTPTPEPTSTPTEPAPKVGYAVGNLAPAFTLPSAAGPDVSMESYRGEKSLAVVFYRAFW